MAVKTINGTAYKLPVSLNKFQLDMYVHLINWKWRNISRDEGKYTYKGTVYKYDAVLQESVHNKFPLIYPTVLADLKDLQKKYYFKLHQHFNHMASSQAANVNLFLPILLSPKANDIFQNLKPDFQYLAVDQLYKGFRIEYWDGNSNTETGLLGDHSARSGTDSDIAIAYYNNENELCLWLIEHKLTEKEFTECGGYKSKNNKSNKHMCEENSYENILKNKDLCYYTVTRKFNYWDLTDTHKSFFVNHAQHSSCPFMGGINQLWRNQLIGLELERMGKYKHVYFSVVKHPENISLDKTISEYQELIDNNPKFSAFNSKQVVDAVASINDPDLNKWVKWYNELYKII